MLLIAGFASSEYGGACTSMRTIASGAPFSMARIGSTSPELVETLVEPAATCWITAALDCAKTVSGLMPAAANRPFSIAT